MKKVNIFFLNKTSDNILESPDRKPDTPHCVGFSIWLNLITMDIGFHRFHPKLTLIIKALIATESGFNPNSWNKMKGPRAAYGLMQVLKPTIFYLKEESNELKDHFITLDQSDLNDPNLNICAAVRWLFRKKEIAEARLKKPVSWRDAVRV